MWFSVMCSKLYDKLQCGGEIIYQIYTHGFEEENAHKKQTVRKFGYQLLSAK